MFADYPDVVSINELSAMLNIGTVLAYKLVKTKKIKCRKVGREYKIPKTAVIEFLVSLDKEENKI